MKKFPAVVVGGPPHSGKSVLTYNLSQVLRRQQVDHLLVRACPDGEGDWTHETPPETVKKIRNKGPFTPTYVQNMGNALPKRRLPLIVDVGGRISDEQRAICKDCTHIILVAANLHDLAEWRSFAKDLQLTVIAEIHSTLINEEGVLVDAPIFSGRITGLERNNRLSGYVFDRLVWVLHVLFAQPESELRHLHIAEACSNSLEFDRIRKFLGLQGWRWEPADLPKLLNSLSADEHYSLYGRGPTWLYCCVVAHLGSSHIHQFHPLLGWIEPIQPVHQENAQSLDIDYDLKPEPFIADPSQANFPTMWRLKARIKNDNYLDYESQKHVEVPNIPMDKGIILDGELPQWFVSGLVRAYGDAPILAIYQPQIGAVIVKSASPEWPVGQVIPVSD